jgi:hypothetical protein
MEVFTGGTWRTITSAEAYIGGAWQRIQYAEAYVNGAWRQIVSFAAPYTALVVSPSPVSASAQSDTITTESVSATPTGGLAPFTYNWTLVSSSGLTVVTILFPNSSSTPFTATLSPGGEGASGSATFTCTATDSLGSSKSASVNVGFFHDFPPGGGA